MVRDLEACGCAELVMLPASVLVSGRPNAVPPACRYSWLASVSGDTGEVGGDGAISGVPGDGCQFSMERGVPWALHSCAAVSASTSICIQSNGSISGSGKLERLCAGLSGLADRVSLAANMASLADLDCIRGGVAPAC